MVESVKTNLEVFKNLVNRIGTTPARTNLFSLFINKLPNGLQSTAIEMSQYYAVSVNIPSKNIMTNSTKREHADFEVPYGISYEPLTVTFYMDTNFDMRDLYNKWYNLIYDTRHNGIEFYDNYIGDLVLHPLNKKYENTYEFIMKNAYPKSISGANYDSSSQVDIMTFTVHFQYEKLIENKFAENIPFVPPNSLQTDSQINSSELNMESALETSIFPKTPLYDSFGVPYMRTEETDETYTILNSPANMLSEIQNVELNVFSKFSPGKVN